MGNCYSNDEEDAPVQKRRESEVQHLLHDSGPRTGYGKMPVDIPSGLSSSYSTASPGPPSSSYPCSSPMPIPTSFTYLEDRHHFSVPAPRTSIPQLQDLYKAVYDRYEVAFTNREKIDELVHRFKDTIKVHQSLHMRECFQAWKDRLKSPVFTVEYSSSKPGDVKAILVRADQMPRELWPAQKYIRELLQALSLFVDQYGFIEQVVQEGLQSIEGAKTDRIIASSNSSKSEKRSIENEVKELNTRYRNIPKHLMTFNRQVSALVSEINKSVSVLT